MMGRALIIGIDAYSHLSSKRQLRGAVPDAQAMAKYLGEHLRWPHRHLLLDGEATRDRILAALEDLAKAAQPEEPILIYFSGHGSRTLDDSDRGGDGWQETLVPTDVQRGGAGMPSREITSTELRQHIVRLTEVTSNVTLIFDCCHAGTLSRTTAGNRVRSLPGTVAKPFEEPSGVARRAAYLPPYDQRYVLLAACRNREVVPEIQVGDPPCYRGALTYFLLEALREATARTTWRDLLERVTVGLRAWPLRQRPQLEGAVDRQLFSLAERRSRHALIQEGRKDSKHVLLNVGKVHDIHPGSLWGVVPVGMEVPTDRGSGWRYRTPGRLRVTRVYASTSDAQPVQRAEICLPGARAVLLERGEAPPLQVGIVAGGGFAQAVEDLEEELHHAPLLLHSDPAGAEVQVVLQAGYGTTEEPVWLLMGGTDQLLARPRRLSDPLALNDLIVNLQSYARWRGVQTLRAAGDPFGEFHFEVLRQDAAHPEKWRPLRDGESFHPGERFAVELEHHHTQPLHIYVLSLAVDGEIRQVYPARGACDPLVADRKISHGVEESDAVRFTLQRGYPFEDPGAPVEVTEVLKLIVTEAATDFGLIFQDRFRSLRGWRDHYQRTTLGQHLLSAWIGRRRDTTRGPGGVVEPWAVRERVVPVMRRERE